MYRVIQQAITNVIQHARAESVVVEVRWAGKELTLSIIDDGLGFDLDNLEKTPETGHFGLVNLRDRIEGLNGVLHIESRPSKGTTVRARVPTHDQPRGPSVVQSSTFVLGTMEMAYGPT